jgi:hypothetical protein
MHIVIERRSEAVQKGNDAEAWAIRDPPVAVTGWIRRPAEQPFDLAEKDPRQGRDGRGPVRKESSESLWHRNHPLPARYRGKDAVDEMLSCLRHPAAVA